MSNIPDEILKARKQYKTIKIHCPSMDDNLNPVPELLNGECEYDRNGKCGSCDKFKGFWNEDRRVFSYGVYEGFCDNK